MGPKSSKDGRFWSTNFRSDVNQASDSFDQNTSQSRSVPFAFRIKLGKRTLSSAAK